MKRAWVVALLVTVIGAGWMGRDAVAKGQWVLKIATVSPENTSLTNALHAASQEIEQRTAGRVSLKIYPGAVMGNDNVVLRKIRSGQLHGSTFTAGGISAEYRDYQVLCLPLLFRNYAEVDAVRAAVEPKLTRALEQGGFISMGIVEAGFAYMMSNTAITSLEKMRGRRVWVPEGDPIGSRALKELGVPPVPLPLTDVLTSLQTGMLDTVASSPIGTLVLRWYTRVKYLTDSPLMYSYGTLAFSKQAWAKIPPADQPVVREILTRHMKRIDKQNRVDNDNAMVTLKKQGLQVVQISADSLPKMQAIANHTIDSLVREGQFDAGLVAEIRGIIAGVRQGK